ncbi:MAG TPA: hypothetical protein PKN80_00265 [bacterium]|uniref:Uroporphyrinogen decarboxylase (URO-D) n=1 Tax=candidate division TA06 bacterium ADurb.Bin417 TaxID=1852828 RepID=A0A1V5MGK5_UNCT6|nr:MAG: hypothetical protein BWY73_00891 [candidate division TA06 bacterium ADurb.Bin417]HNQ34485.1 hypothetical protein [bacterium]HNS49409.1 hypothetical protein [bacterium]
MEFIFYRYNHAFYVLKPDAIRDDYREIKDLGGDAVGFAATIEDVGAVPRSILKHIELMRETGLRPYFTFGRWGGLFAAAAVNTSSRRTFQHRDWWKRDPEGNPPGALVCCVNNPGFREYFFEVAERAFAKFRPDGLIMDEPKDSNWPCYCPHCRKLGDPAEIHIPTLAKFLGEVCTLFKRTVPGGATYLFHMPWQEPSFYEATAREADLDYLGVDGPTCRQVKENGADIGKKPLLESIEVIYPVAERFGKKKLVLPENFDVPAGEEENYYRNARKVLQTRPDAVIFHHYGFENEDPDLIMKHIARLIGEFK